MISKEKYEAKTQMQNETCIFLEFFKFFGNAKKNKKCKPLIPTPYLDYTLSPMYKKN